MAMNDNKSILRVLREKFKYTQEEVSKYLGISQPAYLKYETGETEVSMEGLEKLARLYGIDEYDILEGNMEQVNFAYAFRRDGVANLEEVSHFQQIVKNYIMMSNELEKSDKIQLELLSLSLRQEQGVKFNEPVSVHQMLRNKNIIASFQPLSEGFEGMAIKILRKEHDVRLFMLVNTSSNYSRQRFTACHELYHLLFQEDFSVSYETDNEDGKRA